MQASDSCSEFGRRGEAGRGEENVSIRMPELTFLSGRAAAPVDGGKGSFYVAGRLSRLHSKLGIAAAEEMLPRRSRTNRGTKGMGLHHHISPASDSARYTAPV